jgi:hypothetical protein
LERSFDLPGQHLVVGPLVDLLYRRLPARLEALASVDAMSLASLAACVDSFEPKQVTQSLPGSIRRQPAHRVS